MNELFEVVKKYLVVLVVLLIVAMANGIIIKLLWNWLVPDIFGLTTITYWQGVGLSALCSILFMSIGATDN